MNARREKKNAGNTSIFHNISARPSCTRHKPGPWSWVWPAAPVRCVLLRYSVHYCCGLERGVLFLMFRWHLAWFFCRPHNLMRSNEYYIQIHLHTVDCVITTHLLCIWLHTFSVIILIRDYMLPKAGRYTDGRAPGSWVWLFLCTRTRIAI